MRFDQWFAWKILSARMTSTQWEKCVHSALYTVQLCFDIVEIEYKCAKISEMQKSHKLILHYFCRSNDGDIRKCQWNYAKSLMEFCVSERETARKKKSNSSWFSDGIRWTMYVTFLSDRKTLLIALSFIVINRASDFCMFRLLLLLLVFCFLLACNIHIVCRHHIHRNEFHLRFLY